jgi:hypothetical protein
LYSSPDIKWFRMSYSTKAIFIGRGKTETHRTNYSGGIWQFPCRVMFWQHSTSDWLEVQLLCLVQTELPGFSTTFSLSPKCPRSFLVLLIYYFIIPYLALLFFHYWCNQVPVLNFSCWNIYSCFLFSIWLKPDWYRVWGHTNCSFLLIDTGCTSIKKKQTFLYSARIGIQILILILINCDLDQLFNWVSISTYVNEDNQTHFKILLREPYSVL